MAWCCQATSHYLSQYWPRSMSPYGITWQWWVTYWGAVRFPVISIIFSFQSSIFFSFLIWWLFPGGPGSGKAKQCKSLVARYSGWIHLSMGELIRNELLSKGDSEEKWQVISSLISKGELAPEVSTVIFYYNTEASQDCSISITNALEILASQCFIVNLPHKQFLMWYSSWTSVICWWFSARLQYLHC